MGVTYSILTIGLNAAETSFISTHFLPSGYQVVAAADIADAREKLKAQKIDLIYIQASVQGRAVEKLEEISALCPSLPVVLVCQQSSESIILEAWRAGATDILFMPLTAQALDASHQRAIRKMGESAGKTTVAARLVYLDENGEECSVTINSPRFTIGRGLDNSLSLRPLGVSRSHAEVLIQNDAYLLRDVAGKGGTFLNGAQVKEATLTDGDRIQLGGSQGVSLTFHMTDILQSLLGGAESTTGLQIRDFKDVGNLFATLQAFSSIPVLDDLLALVVDTAIELTGTERGFIMLKEKSGELSFRCARNNKRHPLDGSVFQTSQRVPQDVFKTGRPAMIQDLDVGEGATNHNMTRQLGLRSISCVPLRYMTARESSGSQTTVGISEIIGVLYVDSVNVGAGMSNTRVNALETLASEAAMAIYNARLYKDSQNKRKMDEQLAIAREIQQALLPKPDRDLKYLRACGRSIPCYEIGGDYFDYFELQDGCFGFAVGDVTGKGMPAALLASLVQGIFSTQTFRDAPLSDVIAKVNNNLVRRGTGDRFITFFFGIVDPDGNCSYVNAGHNPPFLLRSDGSMEELLSGGMVLGLFAGVPYETMNIKLQPQDHLVLFTDGLVEALNDAGDEFGNERIMQLLRENAHAATPEILSRLQDAVLTFAGNAPQHDDITIMILGFREPPATSEKTA
jgi:phosphoserine phosphatase RsbU/P